ARTVSQQHNVVVLVPSKRQASVWTDEADLTVSKAEQITAAVDRLTRGHVGLVVIINRYDGIDLPDQACRLLIVDSLPFAYNGIERREAIALRDSEAMVTRQLQRLEQGMGRGVRSRDDRCVVLLLGSRLIQLLAHPEYADRMSAATRAQLDVSRKVAARLEGSDVEALQQVITQVIDDDPGFRKLSREALVGITYSPASVSPSAIHLRAAYNSAVGNRPAEAAAHAKAAVDAARSSGDSPLAGWLGETQATYLHSLDPVAAQKALTDAGRLNTAVLKPRGGMEYDRIGAPSAQAQQASTYLSERYLTGHDLILGMDAMMADIEWDKERTPEAEAALAELGLHLGFTSQMPERDYGIGCDVLWNVGHHAYWVIEAKTGAEAPLVWKHHINQLGGSVNWCHKEYGGGADVVPIMVHPSHVIEQAGTPPLNTRVINAQKLRGLKAAVRRFARAIASSDKPADVEKQLTALKLDAGSFIASYTQLAYREPRKP
ncbi:helicase c2, partial [Micromonospora sp. ATCC 39149]|uniref:helicase C-terminal domain-containing protein n=1 Tax=Micromonospora sp. (strain ATCC 39149 / NRRL 15099 / SCC 1413) TaxID=219305 RepID=UPI0001A50932